jgi:hypothetical protein
MAMNKKELAALLNGREYGNEMDRADEFIAKENNLVVVFGRSDDLMEFRGAIDDELSAWEGTTAHIVKSGLLANKCPEDDCPYYEELKTYAQTITQIWVSEGYSWVYETSIPHETFDILEDGEKYCRGIVFSLSEV